MYACIRGLSRINTLKSTFEAFLEDIVQISLCSKHSLIKYVYYSVHPNFVFTHHIVDKWTHLRLGRSFKIQLGFIVLCMFGYIIILLPIIITTALQIIYVVFAPSKGQNEITNHYKHLYSSASPSNHTPWLWYIFSGICERSNWNIQLCRNDFAHVMWLVVYWKIEYNYFVKNSNMHLSGENMRLKAVEAFNPLGEHGCWSTSAQHSQRSIQYVSWVRIDS